MSTNPDSRVLEEVRRFCTEELVNGDADAGYQLALMDLGLAAWAPDSAIPRIREAADAGVAEAQYWLAWQLESGPLLADDIAGARNWYEAAAAQEHRLALLRLADAYAAGELGLTADALRAAQFRGRAERCASN